jgi:ring-1,2-phenylacetyl-CoA epoxidase subunit PaaD
MVTNTTDWDIDKVWDLLKEVEDPEIPVLNVVDMGVVRKVQLKGDSVIVDITPTYSGCPAMKTIEEDIEEILKEQDFSDVKVNVVLSPAWTTDWMTDDAKKKLREYGIAPPEHSTADKSALMGKDRSVTCPQCGSKNTEMVSQFGSTACKALWKCKDCLEPFDYFKCI